MTDDPLRVLLWAPVPPPLGGVARWAERYGRSAAAAGIEVETVDTAPRTEAFTERSEFRLDRLKPAARAFAQLSKTLARFHPQVAHLTTTLSWATPRDIAAAWVCQRVGVPTVLHIRASTHIIEWRDKMPAWRRALLDHALQSVDAVLVLSVELEAYLKQAVPRARIERIPNMIEVAEAAEQSEGAAVLPPRTRPRVLFIGKRTPKKGVGELADAVLALDGVELAIVGGPGGAIDPEHARTMEASLAQLRAAGRLVETDELPPEQVTRAYREADVFCLPTWREGLPNVLLEAMAAGMACVATPVGAIPEVLREDRGILVPVNDRVALTEALGRLLADSELRRAYGQRAQQAALAEYGTQAVMARYRALYVDLIAQRGSGGQAARRN